MKINDEYENLHISDIFEFKIKDIRIRDSEPNIIFKNSAITYYFLDRKFEIKFFNDFIKFKELCKFYF